MCNGVRFYTRSYKYGNDLKRVSWVVKYVGEDGVYQYGITEEFFSVEMDGEIHSFVGITPLNAVSHPTYKVSLICAWNAEIASRTATRTYLPLHHLLHTMVLLLFEGETCRGTQIAHLIEAINPSN
jgi:hypothetical protein